MDYRLSKHAIDVMNARGIMSEWVTLAIDDPSKKNSITANETHYFKSITENEDRCLKVVFNPISMIVVTVYFDRNMRKRGCR